MTRAVLTILAAVFCSSATLVYGSPISYSLTTTASGTLGGSSFTNAIVTVTLNGDTANVMPGPSPFTDIVVNQGNAAVNVSGIGTGTFTDPIVIASTLNDLTIFGTPTVIIVDNTISGTGILLQTGPVFSTYDLRSSLGPVTGTGGVASGSHITPVFPTTAGNLTWTVGQQLGTSTFTAVVAAPEPAGLILLGSGLAALFARRFTCRARRR